MKLNKTPNPLNREARNKENENWDKIERNFNNVVEEVSDRAFDKVIDGSKIDWSQMVDDIGDLPTDANEGETRGVMSDNKIYRFNGADWVPITEINLNPIAEVDQRLTAQMEKTDEDAFYNSMINRKKSKGCITLIDDDGQVGFYTKLKKFVEEYNIPFTSAIITSRNFGGGNMTLEQIKEMQSLGCEFISHTHTHNNDKRLVTMTEEELHEEFSTSKRIMKELGLNDNFVAYPYGSHNELVRDVARQYFLAGIDTWWDASLSPEGQIVKNPFNQYAIQRVNVQIGEEIAYQYMDEAADKETWFVGVMHVDQQGWYTDQYMRNLIDYALSKGLEFITVEEGVRRFGNLAQFGDTIISNDGTIHSDKLANVEFPKQISDYPINAPITDFPVNKSVKLRVRDVDTNQYGLKFARGGTLDVYRYADDIYSFQRFKERGRGDVRYRSWDADSEEWGKWESVNKVLFPNLGDYEVNAPITDFPADKTFNIPVKDVEVGGYGLKSKVGGTIIVNRYSEDVYSHQIFISRDGMVFNYRSWNHNSDIWNDWKNLNRVEIPLLISDYAINAPVTDFPKDKVVYLRVRNNDASAYGLPTGGAIKVYRFSEEYYSYQEYVSARTGTVLRRYWDNNEWSNWQ